MQYEGWEGFVPGKWNNDEVDVRDFIQRNYTPYEGDAFSRPQRRLLKSFGTSFLICPKKNARRAGYWTRIRKSFLR